MVDLPAAKVRAAHIPPFALAVRVEDLGEKEAVLAANPKAFFTIPHFDGFSAVLVQLKLATKTSVKEALTDGWLACAPPALVSQFLNR